ncbi:MAG: hypothetical protein ACKPJF_27320 [Dolichospermum sp.]
MTVAELRTKLATLLDSDLVKYSNNQLSIWVYGAAQDPPSASDGLECLNKQMPLNPEQGSSGGQLYKQKHWIVTLKIFKKSYNLVNAIRKIETNFVVRQYSYFPFTATVFEKAINTNFLTTTINN